MPVLGNGKVHPLRGDHVLAPLLAIATTMTVSTNQLEQSRRVVLCLVLSWCHSKRATSTAQVEGLVPILGLGDREDQPNEVVVGAFCCPRFPKVKPLTGDFQEITRKEVPRCVLDRWGNLTASPSVSQLARLSHGKLGCLTASLAASQLAWLP